MPRFYPVTGQRYYGWGNTALATHPFPQLEDARLAALFTPAEHRTTGQQEAARHSDDAIAEIMAADLLVVGAPLYTFTIPSTLKAWIDLISRAGITFKYTVAGFSPDE